MNIKLTASKKILSKILTISGSKSESNRLLVLQKFYPNLILKNLSNAEDTQLLQAALASDNSTIDVHHAGTAMRFLAAYFAMQEGREVILTGSERMQQRPIKILVDALQSLGADIQYLTNEGFPPLKIQGKKITKNIVELSATVSSQYISALILIAPQLENGLTIDLKGKITSLPYLKMTLQLLENIGITTTFNDTRIQIQPLESIKNNQTIAVESDWSSASYFYSLVAISEIGTKISLKTYKENSLQGDKILIEIYKNFGVETHFTDEIICLKKINKPTLQTFEKNLMECPDIAQTLVVTCFGLGINCNFTGLHTLKIKETDRLQALKTELEKVGASVSITENSIQIQTTIKNIIENSEIEISTYNDHRMAMAFAPLALKFPIKINNAEVVNKSYPNFWNDLKTVGFMIEKSH